MGSLCLGGNRSRQTHRPSNASGLRKQPSRSQRKFCIMSAKEENGYVSAVFIHLLEPIADLCDRMIQLPSGEPNEVQAAPRENGYAVSIVALAAFLLEGACARARYVAGSQKERSLAADTFRDLNENAIADKVEEIFVVRDAIAHSHLWTAKISWTENDLRFAEAPARLPGYGDKKFERNVDLTSRSTRKLKLHVFPTRIDRVTAIAVLRQCAEALQCLESKDRRFVYLTPHSVRFAGKLVPFYEWVSQLPV
jgi:hypothetical protein